MWVCGQTQLSRYTDFPRPISVNHLWAVEYGILKLLKLEFLLTDCLPTEPPAYVPACLLTCFNEQSSTQPPFYITIANSPVGDTFGTSNE